MIFGRNLVAVAQMVVIVLLSILLALAMPEDRISIRVLPTSFFAGSTVRVTCRVAQHQENRWLTVAIDGYTRSTFGLDGADAPMTHTRTYDRVPCDVGPAYCEVVDASRKVHRAEAHLLIAGCSDPGDR